ncbi:alpha/beta fold hydrolase [Plantactinospora endophytica]|uniref:AB hydrolase-1 domain-containing protein n=1 Tax=Plantactinospora endophytica TaxID=673535 RepID=A0ABQ4E0I4_9ACTN|nr:alpha/beta hydrolase [Plantactinospora endophytica]GIG88182.1 hypothetical protein Pen02_31180 [Plantactinospora endophytica]
MSRPDGRPTIVVAHGAWHRPSSWDATREALAGLGYQTRVPALPSAGREPAPTASMYDDAEVLRREVAAVDGPVAVLAHSYGGVPTAQGVADPTRVTRLVFVAAYLLDEGESIFTFHRLATPEDTSGTFPLIRNPRVALYHDMPDAPAGQALDGLVAQSLRSFTDPVTTAAWRDIPSTYVVCADDRALRPVHQEKMSARATTRRRLAGGHSPYLAAPERFAALVDEILRSDLA